MTTINLSKDYATTVRVGEHLFDLCEDEDGKLYIAASNCGGLLVTISDDEGAEVTVDGQWLTVCPMEKPEEE